ADPSLVTLTDRNLVVVDEDGPEQGRTKPVDAGEGNVIQAASETKADAFEQVFLDRLNQE
ncbi:MAG: hypothetical protein IT323_22035, partial [Anaerolineae bacterium]|nr:hypothetical protein [Anaerolineae bacterium]